MSAAQELERVFRTRLRAWGGATRLAREAGVSVSEIAKMNSGRRRISARVAGALGFPDVHRRASG